MSSKQTERAQVPMVAFENSNPAETGDLVVATTTTRTIAVVETSNHRDLTSVQTNRDSWSNRIVYLLSIIGFVVDLGTFRRVDFD